MSLPLLLIQRVTSSADVRVRAMLLIAMTYPLTPRPPAPPSFLLRPQRVTSSADVRVRALLLIAMSVAQCP